MKAIQNKIGLKLVNVITTGVDPVGIAQVSQKKTKTFAIGLDDSLFISGEHIPADKVTNTHRIRFITALCYLKDEEAVNIFIPQDVQTWVHDTMNKFHQFNKGIKVVKFVDSDVPAPILITNTDKPKKKWKVKLLTSKR